MSYFDTEKSQSSDTTTWFIIFAIVIILILVAIVGLSLFSSSWVSTQVTEITNIIASIPAQIVNALNTIWENISKSIQDIINGIIGGFPRDQIQNLINQARQRISDFADYFSKFFGSKAADVKAKVQDFLTKHVTMVSDWAQAIKENRMDIAINIENAIRNNANQFAAYLHSLKPESWNLNQMQTLFGNYITAIKSQIVADIGGNVQDSINAFVNLQNIGKQISIAISSGLAK
jgi:gas vesicle protein